MKMELSTRLRPQVPYNLGRRMHTIQREVSAWRKECQPYQGSMGQRCTLSAARAHVYLQRQAIWPVATVTCMRSSTTNLLHSGFRTVGTGVCAVGTG
jgi:hypothetical protein